MSKWLRSMFRTHPDLQHVDDAGEDGAVYVGDCLVAKLYAEYHPEPLAPMVRFVPEDSTAGVTEALAIIRKRCALEEEQELADHDDGFFNTFEIDAGVVSDTGEVHQELTRAYRQLFGHGPVTVRHLNERLGWQKRGTLEVVRECRIYDWEEQFFIEWLT